MQEISGFLLHLWQSYEGVILAILKSCIALGIGIFLAFFSRKKIKSALMKKDEILAQFISQIIFFSLLALALITALGTLGVQTNSIVALLGTIGLAIALGLKNSLSNLASGIMLIVLRPFKKGDFIQVGSTKGRVQALNLFQATLELDNQAKAIIPNESVAKATIINHANHQPIQTSWLLTLNTSVELSTIRQILGEALEQIDKQTQHKKSSYKLISLQNRTFVFAIELWIKDSKIRDQALQDLINILKVQFPHIEITLKD